MKAVCLIFFVAGLGIAATSCSSDEEEEDLFTSVLTNSLPMRLVEKSQMPEWLAEVAISIVKVVTGLASTSLENKTRIFFL